MKLVNRTITLDVWISLNGLNATSEETRKFVEEFVTEALVAAAMKPPPIKNGEKFSRIMIHRVQSFHA